MIRMNETIERGMVNLTLLITTKCTLNCDLCATYTPQQERPQHFTYETLSCSIAQFMESMDRPIGIVTISGGEPLMHPQLPELVDFVGRYEARLEMLEIITNGTIVPSNVLLQALKKFPKANLLVDDYGPKLSVNIDKVCSAFEKNGIAYRHRNYNEDEAWFGGWIDVSDFSEKQRSKEETRNIFSKCAFMNEYRNSWFVIDGVAHICYVNRKLLPFVSNKSDEYVNLLDKTLSNGEIQNQLFRLRERDHLLACMNCNGYLTESEHKKPAVQLPRGSDQK
jgi:organic radical activating enzyme